MTSSEEQKCRVCDFKAPIEEWEIVTEGRRKVLFVECSFRYCTREWCSFKAPLKTWKIKAGGVLGKWCERCCEVAKTRKLNKSDEVKEDDYKRNQSRKSVMVKCPNCNKEIQTVYMSKHLRTKSCIDNTVNVSAD